MKTYFKFIKGRIFQEESDLEEARAEELYLNAVGANTPFLKWLGVYPNLWQREANSAEGRSLMEFLILRSKA